jgi:hypothetical protein
MISISEIHVGTDTHNHKKSFKHRCGTWIKKTGYGSGSNPIKVQCPVCHEYIQLALLRCEHCHMAMADKETKEIHELFCLQDRYAPQTNERIMFHI